MEKHNFEIILFLLLYCSKLGKTNDHLSLNDYIRQDQIFRRNMPPYLPQVAVENILLATKGKLLEQYTEGALPASQFYQGDARSHRNASIDDESNVTSSHVNDITNTMCYKLIVKVKTDLQLGRMYASYMDDSNGRQESGLLKGNFRWYGRYYECQGQTDGEAIIAKMCLVTHGNDETGAVGLKSGLCVPDVCTEDEVAQLYKEFLLPEYQYANATCPEKLPWTAVDIVLVVILSMLILLVLAGTILEAIYKNTERKNLFLRILICFSAKRNTAILCNTERKESAIPVIDGIRFFSMTWVIMGHTLSTSSVNIDNIVDLSNYYSNHFGSMVIINGTLSVDSFFFLSGLLVTYLALRNMKRNGGKLNILHMYLQRYLRLTPVLILIILFSLGLFLKIGEGLWYQTANEPFISVCQKYWWTNILYINNLYPAELGNECVSWTWYLANDWQFFLVAPLFLHILYRKPRIGMITLGFGLLGSMAITGALARHFNLVPDMYSIALFSRCIATVAYPVLNNAVPKQYAVKTNDVESQLNLFQLDGYFDDIYTKPWCRIGVYFIGMATGYILYATNKKLKIKKIFVVQLWIVVAAVELAVVYGWWDRVDTLENIPSNDLMAFYEAMRRPVWGFGLMWIVIACSCGYGGPINTFLSWKGFIPLGRLTFSTYMFHVFVILFEFTSREEEVHLGVDTYIYYFLASLVLSMMGGYVLFIIIESPVAEMQKMFLGKPNCTQSKQGMELKSNHVATIQPTEDTKLPQKLQKHNTYENIMALEDDLGKDKL